MENVATEKKSSPVFGTFQTDSAHHLIEEHKINKDHAIIEGFHEFDEFDEKNNKKKIGFYGYLILTVVVLFALFIALSISKDLIISKYPITESYIQYFFEIIEIVKITIRDL